MYAQPIKLGAISGAIVGALFLIFYFIDYSICGNMWVGFALWGVSFVIPVVAAVRFKKANGGVISVKQGFLALLLSGIAYLVAKQVLVGILFNIIDPELGVKLYELNFDKSMDMMRSFGMSEDEAEEAMIQGAAQAESQGSPGQILIGLVIGAISYAIYGLIVGLIIGKRGEQ